MAHKKAHVFYSGQVQGVGFRYAVQDIAMAMGVTGWVKNLEDGRVEVVAEGKEKDLKEFFEKISRRFLSRYIKDVEVFWEAPKGEFDSFEIAF